MLIDIISPSGAFLDLADLSKFDGACQRLRSLGYELRIQAPREGWQRFGGDDTARLAMIHSAALGSADAVMLTRGGYGLSRLLDRIDWSLIEAAIDRGQIWLGFSDFTAFQTALYARGQRRSFAGPTVTVDFGGELLNPLMLAGFQALLRGVTPIVQWDAHSLIQVEPPAPSFSVEGKLWGGNLSMLCSLIGTPYFPAIRDLSILWLEDVAEHPYRIERMLHQLFFSGILKGQKAIVFGQFNQWKPAAHDQGFGWDAMVEYFQSRLHSAYGEQAPVIVQGLPFGHQAEKAILEFGRKYRLLKADGLFSLLPL
jgi:muramoyltetrapeptide carboxypeptidase